MLGQNFQKAEIPLLSLENCIAKTCNDRPGVTVEMHCRIVGLVASELIELFPISVQKELFPKGTDLVAACHDIGKISPAFQKMIYGNLSENERKTTSVWESVSTGNAGRKMPGFHASVSQVSISDVGAYIPEILGMHHGFTPNTMHMEKGCDLHGGIRWQEEREILISHLHDFFSYDTYFWPEYTETQASAVSGLVTVADWIGSGDFFSEYSNAINIGKDELQIKVAEAVRSAGFHKIHVAQGVSFTDAFPFSPNAVQEKLISVIEKPGLYILEAPMGIGKTEAALFSAYKILEKGEATGIYFALPTQLTSEKIHDRMESFLNKIVVSSSKNDHAYLLHGSAWLKKTMMGEDADAGGSWFDNRKRGILAPFAAGTIDQALMAVMNVRHGFVRTFGLAGKVVILDEIHSYDSFTGTILNRLVDDLLKLHCTIILLSATLSKKQRREITRYDTSIPLSSEYPLITAITNDSLNDFSELACSSDYEREVAIHNEVNISTVIEESILRAKRGEQVLWIENTVFEAQEVFKKIMVASHGLKIECGILHSRFIRRDRDVIENKWVSLLGKDGVNIRKEKGRILVGTQVLEQSIDIDADFLVTRLCPTDMLLQRIGRLWRHKKLDSMRPPESSPETVILVPSIPDRYGKQREFGSSGFIYSNYVLLRTLEIWEELTVVNLPNDIRFLIEKTYLDREDVGVALRYKRDLLNKRDTLERLARLGLSRGIKTLPESKASTRYSELETVDVLLIDKKREKDGVIELYFLDGSRIVIPKETQSNKKRREISAMLMNNTVRVSDYLSPRLCNTVNLLSNYVYTGSKNDDEEPFRVAQLSRDDEVVSCDGSFANQEYILHYSSVLGYQSKKRQGERNV